MTTRLSRVEQVERNRGLVLDAARRVFLDRGYAGATLEVIAEEAGFSKGVMYSQFASKPDLFLALLEQRIAERAEENARIAADHTGIDGLGALLRTNVRHTEDGGGWPLLLVEFRVVAARDPELNARYAALHARAVDQFAEAVRTILARDGLAPVYPARTFAELIFAMDQGKVLEQAAGAAELRSELLIDLLGRLVEPS
jgi:AcrR family transcriptional regulator